jgi:uncharacterized radical SAM superfamily Fe-S cluster-containing enzyme
MSNQILNQTESVCPECLKRIPAKIVAVGDNVYLEKSCSEHGDFKVLIWRGVELYREWGKFGTDLGSPRVSLTNISKGCPYDCGLCPEHKAETCIAIMDITNRCNLSCPICFASANDASPCELNLNTIKQMFQSLSDATGYPPVQLSGGEPTTRDDLPQIVQAGRKMGFDHIMVNTNGLRIAEDIGYLQRLKDSGTSLIYLQFDGVTDEVYRYTRGRDLKAIKVQAIENCAKVKIGVMLVPTLIPKINDGQIGDIIRFARKWIPTVKGIHFQPISYFGRYREPPKDEDRITIPDVLQAIETQTEGEIKAGDFAPRRRKESYCAFSGFFVQMSDGKLMPITSFKRAQKMVGSLGYMKEAPFLQARRFLKKKWRLAEEEGSGEKYQPGSLQQLVERAKTFYLALSCMPFQDAWNIDLARLKRCCTHVVNASGKIVPLCAFYLTNSQGERLYNNRKP